MMHQEPEGVVSLTPRVLLSTVSSHLCMGLSISGAYSQNERSMAGWERRGGAATRTSKDRVGQGYIAVPAYKGSLAEA
eukprot:85668-Pelagomonas_calceolata.AAC.1